MTLPRILRARVLKGRSKDMQQEIRKSLIESAAWEADIDVEENLRWEYGGRGMYGKKCPGIVGTVGDLARFFVELTKATIDSPQDDFDADTAQRLAEDTTEDQMGRYAVFYWPSFKSVEG